MKAVGALLVVAGAGVLIYALAAADLLPLILWWAFGGAQPPASMAAPLTLGIGGALIIAGGVAVWQKADKGK